MKSALSALLFLAFFGLLPQLAWASPLRVTATYDLLQNGQMIGQVSETFSREGKNYRIESVTRAAGLLALLSKDTIRLISTGKVDKTGLKPLHFEHHRGSDPAKAIVANFDWAKNTLVMNYDGESKTAPLEPGTQDRLSRMYQFMFLGRLPKAMNFYMTNGKKIDQYRYTLTGEEKLQTPAGEFATVHYSRQHAPDEDGTELWLATGNHDFPVRLIIQDRDGRRLEQILTHLRIE